MSKIDFKVKTWPRLLIPPDFKSLYYSYPSTHASNWKSRKLSRTVFLAVKTVFLTYPVKLVNSAWPFKFYQAKITQQSGLKNNFSVFFTNIIRKQMIVLCNISSIPTHGNSLGKWMNLCPGQPMPCEGNWSVQGADRTLTYIVSIIAKMGFSASCNSTIYTFKVRGGKIWKNK